MKKLILLSMLFIVGCNNSTEPIEGCMDTNADNYNGDANADDGSCEYLPLREFTDFETINGMDEFGNPTNIIGDGIWGGCMDTNLNYNSQKIILPIHPTILNRDDDASSCNIIITDSTVLIQSDGYIGGVQMTLSHGADFSIELTKNAMIADYITSNDTTKLLIISPSTNLLFNYIGDFIIEQIIVANSHGAISVGILSNEFSFSSPFPNPFNESTSIIINLNEAGSIKVIIVDDNYNRVATLLDGYLDIGSHPLTWDAANMQDGNYRIIADLGTKQCFVNMNKESNP